MLAFYSKFSKDVCVQGQWGGVPVTLYRTEKGMLFSQT